MVTTLRPNARDTPSRPIPTCGNPAAITALPQPANVSQKVPIASAAYFLVSIMGVTPDAEISNLWEPPRHWRQISQPGAARGIFDRFNGLTWPEKLLHRWTS